MIIAEDFGIDFCLEEPGTWARHLPNKVLEVSPLIEAVCPHDPDPRNRDFGLLDALRPILAADLNAPVLTAAENYGLRHHWARRRGGAPLKHSLGVAEFYTTGRWKELLSCRRGPQGRRDLVWIGAGSPLPSSPLDLGTFGNGRRRDDEERPDDLAPRGLHVDRVNV